MTQRQARPANWLFRSNQPHQPENLADLTYRPSFSIISEGEELSKVAVDLGKVVV